MKWLARYRELGRAPPEGVEIAFLYLHVENLLAVRFTFHWQPISLLVSAFWGWRFRAERRRRRRH